MDKFILTANCSNCTSIYSQTKGSEKDELFALNIDFISGKISFVCPNCNNMNIMEVISAQNYMKNITLPKGKLGRY